jgi:CHASE2 domain-containing sensor protein
VIAGSIEDRKLVFGSFIPETKFQLIPARALVRRDDNDDEKKKAMALCRGRIVVIGGKWFTDLGGEPADRHDSPVGSMAGVYLHANYIEALLDDRYQQEVPLWFSLMFDATVGAFLYFSFHRADTRGRLLILGAVVLLFASYVLFANLNYYLDFILLFIGYFGHLVVEFVSDYYHLRRNPRHDVEVSGV